VAEAKDKAMRDIRSDLQDRANWVRQQIKTEQAQFEIVTAQLTREQNHRLEDLKSQLQAVTRLLQFANRHHDIHMAAARALALAAAAEIAAHQFAQAQDRSAIGRPSI
jgi:ribonucleotide monophosphatase NagD (HAD superfamily)